MLIDVVAPVSPRLLVNPRIAPATTDDLMIGSRIFVKACSGLAPRDIAVSS